MSKEYFLKELPSVVQEFLNNLKSGEKAIVVGLSGDLGAGKTTFAKELARQLGVAESVTSPTFTVLQKYEMRNSKLEANQKLEIRKFKTLVHIDLYRFEEGDDVGVLRLDEIFGKTENLVLIEWIEKFPEIKTDIQINLKHLNEDKREIEIKYE
jgi:tRNA threonylcarbamoyladenosine biosynthesis protein TsaE